MRYFALLFFLCSFTFSLWAQPKILVYVSSARAIPLDNGKSANVGVFLGELTEPLEPLVKEKYELIFATPDGNTPTLDSNSITSFAFKFSKKRLKHALAFYEELKNVGLNKPYKISEVLNNDALLNSIDALFVPGGHAPMTDIVYENWLKGNNFNKETAKLLQHFHDLNKPTALICHGPGALTAAPSKNGVWMYKGYKMTCITNRADKLGEKKMGGHMLAYPAELLKEKGGVVKQSPFLWGSKVVEDRELITAQNPFSAKRLGKKFKVKLKSYISSRQKI